MVVWCKQAAKDPKSTFRHEDTVVAVQNVFENRNVLFQVKASSVKLEDALVIY